MDGAIVQDILRDTLMVTLKISSPPLLAALFIGVIISILQAMTQIQETTLTFVPKILGLFAVFIVGMSYMSSTLSAFTMQLWSMIVAGG